MSWPELVDDLSRQAAIKTYSQTEDYIRTRLKPFWVRHIRLTKFLRRFLRLETTTPEFKTMPNDPLIAYQWTSEVRLSVQPKWLSGLFLRKMQ